MAIKKKTTAKTEPIKKDEVKRKTASILVDEEPKQAIKEVKEKKAVKVEAAQEVKAHLNYFRMSSRKAKLVGDAVKGLPALEAIQRLQLIYKRASKPISDLINSALANGEHNFHLKKDDLIIKNLIVGQGPTLKRSAPAAFGSAHPIRKRSCHLTVILTVKKDTAAEQPKFIKKSKTAK